ncbi:hypothetical protein BOC42_03580 [Burkholderia pseudomallei]|nr:hypothetical protein BOC35_33750 [Burkholderia pseudomallei]ARK52229.1 hypothetical protein BOC36_02920 [Burkholderia pseudomallei]ARK63208.1 hypothetical protein BOC37_26030 [Burkholderia pseudomallei]ARK68510.1 hypothetical protein BOC38_18730 [Burkholderia pseudomallei]ARK86574.1 hypothetical protein BOC42_03580 [Burkholderia pseudomallei]
MRRITGEIFYRAVYAHRVADVRPTAFAGPRSPAVVRAGAAARPKGARTAARIALVPLAR